MLCMIMKVNAYICKYADLRKMQINIDLVSYKHTYVV